MQAAVRPEVVEHRLDLAQRLLRIAAKPGGHADDVMQQREGQELGPGAGGGPPPGRRAARALPAPVDVAIEVILHPRYACPGVKIETVKIIVLPQGRVVRSALS